MKLWNMRLLALTLATTCVIGSASALTVETIKAEDIMSEQMYNAVNVSSWAKEEIDLAREAGLMTDGTTYYLTTNITRLEFAELVVNMVEKVTGEEILPADEATFTDTTEIAALKASAAGIVTGTGDGTTFSPNDETNREQIATMVSRSVDYMETKLGTNLAPEVGELTAFTDATEVSSWATEAVARLAANGIMKGTSATTLSPQATTTKESAILLVYRLAMQG